MPLASTFVVDKSRTQEPLPTPVLVNLCVCVCVCVRAHAQSLSGVQLCNPMDCSPSGSSVHGILQAIYCSGLPFPHSGDLPYPEIEASSSMSPALAGRFFTTEPPGKAFLINLGLINSVILVSELEFIGSGHYTETIIFSCPCDTFRVFANLY